MRLVKIILFYVVLPFVVGFAIGSCTGAYAETSYFSSYTVKKTKVGPKIKKVEVVQIMDNRDGTAEMTIVACGTQLVLTAKVADYSTPGFQEWVMKLLDEACPK